MSTAPTSAPFFSDDVWLNQFVSRYVQTKVRWTQEEIKKRLEDINKKTQDLKQIFTTLKELPNTDSKSQTDTIRKATELKNQIDDLMAPFKDPTFERYKQRILKTERNKRWKKKQASRIKVKKQLKKSEDQLTKKIVGEWADQKDKEAKEQKKDRREKNSRKKNSSRKK